MYKYSHYEWWKEKKLCIYIVTLNSEKKVWGSYFLICSKLFSTYFLTNYRTIRFRVNFQTVPYTLHLLILIPLQPDLVKLRKTYGLNYQNPDLINGEK